MKVSIIVAVYNTEQYLEKCLISLMGQTHRDIEILCVDDCSTDNSPHILHDYAAKDKRIKVFSTQTNSGSAVTRNIAVKAAEGELIAFVDSDDWIDADTIEKAVVVFEQYPETGCVLLDIRYHENNGSERPYEQDSFIVKSGYEAFVDSLTWKIHGLYIAKSELYKKYPYDDTCRSYSDDNTTRLHYYYSKEVRTCEGKYYYRFNSNSITHCRNTSRINYILANESMKKTLLKLNVSDEILSLYETQRWLILVGTYMFYFLNRKYLSKEDKDYCLYEMKRIWKGIETFRIPTREKLKLGYYPFRYSWSLFRIQEEIYFILKSILHKI